MEITAAIARNGIEYHAGRICESLAKGVESFIETGRRIIDAKGALEHGQFMRMVEERLPFNHHTVNKFMNIATDERILKCSHGDILPASWTTLYEMTRLDNGTFKRAIADGTIHPGVERKTITALRKRLRQNNATSSPDTAEDLEDLADTSTKYGCIYADPPWQYGNQGTRAATNNHYPTMSMDEICALPVVDLAAEKAHLHLWTTSPFLPDAFKVIEAWGFTYKSSFVWVKPQMGIGNYWRLSHEFLLLGVRGGLTFQDKSLMSWFKANRTKHSAKPWEVREMIARASPGPRIELFARERSDGWSAWGNQIDRRLFDE